ncbi:MAG TPA: SDR family NAD(P)-dependent oxidoreductase, partial [Gaiellales bacterium]|nr:SDR family NAD(P)-dependent oxidoreductase [Gaiellales bacterium]
ATQVLAGRTLERVQKVAGELDAAEAVQLDVSDASAVQAAVEAAHGRMRGLDVVVSGAAIDTGWAPSADMELEVWDSTIAINLSGTYYVCRAAIALMVADGGGAILNITSVAGHKAWAEDVAYNASKAGVRQMTKTIAVEYATQGIRANCLAPGVIDGGLTDTVTDDADREMLVKMHPMMRMGTTAEVAEAAVWLASDASSFTTGWTLAVDGGFLA